MTKYLIVLIWPAGIALIAGAALLLARRYQAGPAAAGTVPSGRDAGRAGRHQSRGEVSGPITPAILQGMVLLGAVAALGAVVVFGLMCLLGVLVTHNGLAIDKPVFTFVSGHHVHVMKALMDRLTKIGDTWTCWGAATAAAACLAVTWRARRWVPPAAVAALIVIDHYTTLALRHVFHRLGPPTSPLGTFPSGGCDRCIVFYGLIAYLLWREFSGRRSTAMLAGGAVAAIGFNEAYSRVYLSLHWLTDALSGLLYGALLLAVFIVAIRVVIGRPAAVRSGRPAVLPPARGGQAGRAPADSAQVAPHRTRPGQAGSEPADPAATYWPGR